MRLQNKDIVLIWLSGLLGAVYAKLVDWFNDYCKYAVNTTPQQSQTAYGLILIAAFLVGTLLFTSLASHSLLWVARHVL
jgi:hypothetical protein